jgi:16S rRNA (cytidine1402-2'-O)-methyltransferase
VAGTLYVVATPIGNLGDLSRRASEILTRVGTVVAEDTRRTRELLAHLGAVGPRLYALPAFDEEGRVPGVLERLARGEEVALCTDAGTPAVSDPGEKLVSAAWAAGARVVPVPGPCAALAALMASGLPSERFFFQGFLPRHGGKRSEAIAFLARLEVTSILYEAGNRLGGTLEDLAAALPGRTAVVARELTKLHEEIVRGPLEELSTRFAAGARGEVTLVVAGGDGAVERPAEPLEEELVRRLREGESPSAIAREVARGRGLKRSEVYATLERLRKG